MDDKKQAIVDALYAWINQRPGLDPANYFCGGDWRENRRNYDSERRRILRQRNDALRLLRQVELIDSISADDLLAAFQGAFSGRLSCKDISARYDDGSIYWRFSLDYCTGQYWPTEYRAAAAAVLAHALWNWKRDKCMPKPNGKLKRNSAMLGEIEHDNIEGKTPGDWLRSSFRREFGTAFQKRYFD